MQNLTIPPLPSYTKAEFIKTVNDLRLANKGKWFYFSGMVEGKEVKIKCYNTWLQIFRVNGVQLNTCMDITATKFKQELERI